MDPPAKKRASERQLTKDDASSEEEDFVVTEGFIKAPEDKLAQRKIVKVKRTGAGPATDAPKSNPFASVAFGATATASAAEPAAAKPSAAPAPAPAASGATPPAVPPSSAAFATSSFSAFASKNPFASILNTSNPTNGGAAPGVASGSTGSGLASATTGGFGAFATGGFGAAAAAATGTAGFGGFSFGGATTAFGGATLFGGSAAGAKKDTKPADENDAPECNADEGEEEDEEGGLKIGNDRFGDVPSSVLGHGEDKFTPVVVLPPAPERVLTGEEGERTVFTCEGKLYQFDKDLAVKWKERGTGELKVNIGEGGKGRLIMRHKGNMRLALNAALWPGMTISTMEGGRGITFSVVNVANEEGPEERKEAGASASAAAAATTGGEGTPGAKAAAVSGSAAAPVLATYAFRTVPKTMQQPLIDTLHQYKGRAGADDAKV